MSDIISLAGVLMEYGAANVQASSMNVQNANVMGYEPLEASLVTNSNGNLDTVLTKNNDNDAITKGYENSISTNIGYYLQANKGDESKNVTTAIFSLQSGQLMTNDGYAISADFVQSENYQGIPEIRQSGEIYLNGEMIGKVQVFNQYGVLVEGDFIQPKTIRTADVNIHVEYKNLIESSAVLSKVSAFYQKNSESSKQIREI